MLIDVTRASEYASSKLAEVVTVADVDDVDRVGNSLLQIWKLRFGHKAKLWPTMKNSNVYQGNLPESDHWPALSVIHN